MSTKAKPKKRRTGPRGGLTAEGRKHFRRKEGAHLKIARRGQRLLEPYQRSQTRARSLKARRQS